METARAGAGVFDLCGGKETTARARYRVVCVLGCCIARCVFHAMPGARARGVFRFARALFGAR
eukprot:5787049-Lingulodinium_polyedra.AAC.1